MQPHHNSRQPEGRQAGARGWRRRQLAIGWLRRRLRYEEGISRLLSSRLAGRRVLSIGCGEGVIERSLQGRLGVEVYGADLTRYRSRQIPTALADGRALPFRRGSVDTILFIYMLHHTTAMAALLQEAARVARKEIIILDHIYTNRLSRLALCAYDRWANLAYRMPTPLNFLRLREWAALFGRLGLRLDETQILSGSTVLFRLPCGKQPSP